MAIGLVAFSEKPSLIPQGQVWSFPLLPTKGSETCSRSKISNHAKIFMKTSLFIIAIIRAHPLLTRHLISEINSVIYPGSDAGNASPGIHWLSV